MQKATKFLERNGHTERCDFPCKTPRAIRFTLTSLTQLLYNKLTYKLFLPTYKWFHCYLCQGKFSAPGQSKCNLYSHDDAGAKHIRDEASRLQDDPLYSRYFVCGYETQAKRSPGTQILQMEEKVVGFSTYEHYKSKVSLIWTTVSFGPNYVILIHF